MTDTGPAAAQPGIDRPQIDQIVIEQPGLTIRVLVPRAQILVSFALADLAPLTRCGEDPSWLWLAPDQRLLVALAVDPPELPDTAFASDVTDGLVPLEFAGASTRDLIEMATTLDPDGSALAPGRCARTLFAGLAVTLYRVDVTTRFRLHVERSFAPFLLDWLRCAVPALVPGGR